MTELTRIFTPLERQVIVLAATGKRECQDLPRRGRKSWLAGMLARVFPVGGSTPLANERLEALRRLVCACFASRGRPDEQVVRAALEAGLTGDQIATLSHLTRSQD